MNPRLCFLATLLVAGAACGDDANEIDAAPDAPVDAIDAPPGPCGEDVFLTGEYVEWDATSTSFMGINAATWTVRGQPSRTDQTAPNGRVELCIQPGVTSIIDATAATHLDAIFVADPAVFEPPGTFFAVKGITTTRAGTFYQSLQPQQTFDETRAHVLVQTQGTPIPLTLSPGGTAYAVDNSDDTTWTAGNAGGLVLFTNVDVSASSQATLSSTSAFVGPTTLPLEAGKLTITTIRVP
jgi:hypothetical protein